MRNFTRARAVKALIMGCAVAGLGGGTAFAQTGAMAAPEQQAPQLGQDEIVVTAQHRNERLRDVPIAITAVAGTQLESAGINTLQELTAVVPGLRIDSAGIFLQPSLRGISSTTIGPATEAPVAISLDGIPQPNQVANQFNFADLSRIDVLKGPQGTVAGRNAVGGAIQIFTKAPSFTTSADFEIGAGNFDQRLVKGFLTGPLVGDVVAASVSAYYESHNGYVYDIARKLRPKGLDSNNVRGKLLFRPSDKATLTLTASYQDRYDSDAANGIPLAGNTAAQLYGAGTIITTNPRKIAYTQDSYIHVRQTSISLHGEFDLGLGKLKSVSSYSNVKIEGGFEEDRSFNLARGLAFLEPMKDRTYWQELTFASRQLGSFSFVLGGSIYDDNNRFDPLVVKSGPNIALSRANSDPVRAYAGFGEIYYDVTDRLTLTGGLRYSWERRKNSVIFGTLVGDPNKDGVFTPTSTVKGASTQFDAFTPRFSVRYKIDDSTNVYGTVSRGFKSGGTPAYTVGGTINTPQTYKPEYVWAYELGIKSSPMPGMTVNAAIYYNDYTDLQVQAPITAGSNFVNNAASARIYGFEMDATAQVTPAFKLIGGLSLINAKYRKYPNAIIFVPNIVNGQASGNIATVNNLVGTFDASGRTLPRAPKATFSLTGSYKVEFEPGALIFDASAYYSSKIYFESGNRLSQSGYMTINAQAYWHPNASSFSFGIWGKNLTDKQFLTQVYVSAAADGAAYAAPRTYGATIKYNF